MASDNAFDGIDVTADEVQRIEKALKNEEFRKLFVEYAQEISDPENKRKYEEELAELEKSRGMDVKFLHPKPGYVLKTSVDGEKKAFINICKNEHIGKPQATKSSQGSGNSRKVGVQWSLPYSLAPGRTDTDHVGKKCVVYDCMFHPDCFDMINKDGRFQTLLNNSAMDGIEREFGVKLDRNNVKKPKMKFKGRPQATVLRTPNKDGPAGENSLDALNIQYPFDKTKENEVPNDKAKPKSVSKISGNRNAEKKDGNEEKKDGFTKPKYSTVHRGHFDMQQFTFARDSMPSTRPQELIVKVELPLLKSSASVQLDIFEKRLLLECKKPVWYRLDLALPFPVDEDKGSAKFDKSKACLIVTLAVLPPKVHTSQYPSPAAQEAREAKPLVQEIVNNYDSSLRTNEEGTMATKSMDAADSHSSVVQSMEDGINRAGTVEEQLPAEVALETNQASIDFDEIRSDVMDSVSKEEKDGDSGVKKSGSFKSVGDMGDDSFLTPSCDLYQTEDDITLIIRETNIDADSLKAGVTGGGKTLKVGFQRTKDAKDGSSDGPEKMFSIIVGCKEGQSFEEEVAVDVSELNAVVKMKKRNGCGSLWPGMRVGAAIENLKDQLLLSEESLEEVLTEALNDQTKDKKTAPCTVTDFSADCVKAEFQLSHDVKKSRQGGEDVQEVTSTPAEPMIPSLDLERTGEGTKDEDLGSPTSDSQSSPTDTALPPGLKSALRSPRRRACKSVSFSEEVLVEMFLDGPNRGQKGGNKKKGRRSPYFGPRRMIEKLKDNSWESYSDSELLHRNGGSTEEDDDHDHERSEWNWKPDQFLMRQSSSESESGQEVPSSPGTKGKKSKGSRRRRREKARREAASHNGGYHSDTIDNHIKLSTELPAATSEENKDASNAVEMNGEGSHDDESTPVTSADSDLKNNNNDSDKMNENEELPLELQDHKTKCAFQFSNQVIFDLDE